MKTSTIWVGIAIMLLLALPAAASDCTLEIFGNANEDDTINMQDVTYTELIILEYRDRTDLADAKYDGKINMQDVTQIELTILGKELELTILQHVGHGNDVTERAVTVDMPIERIVVLNEGAAEGVLIVGAEDIIVGTSGFAADNPEFWSCLKDTPTVSADNYESIMKLDPNVVINYATFRYDPAFEEKLAPAGIEVVRLDFFKPALLTREVRTLGMLFGREERADEFIDFLDGHLSVIGDEVEQIESDEKKRVFLETWREYPSMSTGAEGSAWHSQIVMAGGTNIFAGSGVPYPQIDPEAVLEKNPEVIIKQMQDIGYTITDSSEMVAARDDIMSRPGWDQLDAVKTGEVYMITNGIAWCGVRKHVGVFYMAKWFHPDLFSDIDPEEFHREWLEKFEGIEYRGTWVYP